MAMFGKKKTPEAPSVAAPKKASAPRKDITYFGKNMTITGNVTGDGDLIILGGFEGNFDLKGQLKIAQGADIKGDIKADEIAVNGRVEGTVTARNKIHLDSTARVKGHIHTPKISVLEGAVFDGDLQMSGGQPAAVKTEAAAASPSKEKTPPSPAPASTSAFTTGDKK